jgi:MerR family transcriptional regulator, light-induced transcriptional regulator
MDDNTTNRDKGAADTDAPPVHPIGVVARRTGISLHVLRAWERRYQVVEPRRTPGGQRLYSDADIARLRLLRRVTDSGHSISQVAALPQAELERLATSEPVPAVELPRVDTEWQLQALDAAERMDGQSVYATLLRAAVSLRAPEFMRDVLMPLLQEVGERWHAGELSPAQEHLVSMAARRVTGWLIDAYVPAPDAPVLLVTTVSGELHEFGALLVSVLALDAGWSAVNLGPSLPAAEVARAAESTGASVVALSIVNRPVGSADDDIVREVTLLRDALRPEVRLVVGGGGAVARRDSLEACGALIMADGAALSEQLHAWSRAAQA